MNSLDMNQKNKFQMGHICVRQKKIGIFSSPSVSEDLIDDPYFLHIMKTSFLDIKKKCLVG